MSTVVIRNSVSDKGMAQKSEPRDKGIQAIKGLLAKECESHKQPSKTVFIFLYLIVFVLIL